MIDTPEPLFVVDGAIVQVLSFDAYTQLIPLGIDDNGFALSMPGLTTFTLHTLTGDIVRTDRPIRTVVNDRITYTWGDRMSEESSFSADVDAVCKSIADDLFKRYPMAAFGPAHVCLEDENYDYYEQAITLCYLAIARRALVGLGWTDDDLGYVVLTGDDDAFGIAVRVGWYADHTIEELGATLAALHLVKWHYEGNVGDPPTE